MCWLCLITEVGWGHRLRRARRRIYTARIWQSRRSFASTSHLASSSTLIHMKRRLRTQSPSSSLQLTASFQLGLKDLIRSSDDHPERIIIIIRSSNGHTDPDMQAHCPSSALSPARLEPKQLSQLTNSGTYHSSPGILRNRNLHRNLNTESSPKQKPDCTHTRHVAYRMNAPSTYKSRMIMKLRHFRWRNSLTGLS